MKKYNYHDLTPLVGMLMVAMASADDYDRAQEYLGEAMVAYQAEDWPLFQEKAQVARELRGDHARYLYTLAAAHALNDNAVEAAEVLQELASWGLHFAAEASPAFESVQKHPDMQAAFAALRKNLRPRGTPEIAFNLPANGGLWEGVASRALTGDTFHSDLHRAQIYRRAATGEITLFTTMPTQGYGCGGLVVDELNQLLWASSPAMPVVTGFTESLTEKSQIVAFDLESGEVARIIDLGGRDEAPSTVVDLTLGSDGTLYAADSISPVIWRILPGADTAESWARVDRPGSRHSLQGAVLSPDGAWLLVADYSTGLHAISTDTADTHFLTWPGKPATTLLGIDGLALQDGRLVATQNGVSPARVLALEMEFSNATGKLPRIRSVRPLLAGHPSIADPTLMTVTDEGVLLIGDAGWSHFGDSPQPDFAEREVPIVRIPRP